MRFRSCDLLALEVQLVMVRGGKHKQQAVSQPHVGALLVQNVMAARPECVEMLLQTLRRNGYDLAEGFGQEQKESKASAETSMWLKNKYRQVEDLPIHRLMKVLKNLEPGISLGAMTKESLLRSLEYATGLLRKTELKGACRHWLYFLELTAFLCKQRGRQPSEAEDGIFELLPPDLVRHRVTQQVAHIGRSVSELVLAHNFSEQYATVRDLFGNIVLECSKDFKNQVIDAALPMPQPSKDIELYLARKKIELGQSNATCWSDISGSSPSSTASCSALSLASEPTTESPSGASKAICSPGAVVVKTPSPKRKRSPSPVPEYAASPEAALYDDALDIPPPPGEVEAAS